MTNKEIANAFQLLGKIMELHGENTFKIRSYSNAYMRLRKLEDPLAEMSEDAINKIPGVGKAIAGKIHELLTNGSMNTLEEYKEKTPPGILEMLQIRGFGPKKIKIIQEGMGIESIGELLYAINENRLIELKGFGKKTQDALREQLMYFQDSKGKYHYASLAATALKLEAAAKTLLPEASISLAGSIRRKCNIVDGIDLLIASDESIDKFWASGLVTKTESDTWETTDKLPVKIHTCSKSEFGSKLFRYTAAKDFMDAFLKAFPGIDFKNLETETAIFEKVGIDYIEPELRETDWALPLAKAKKLPLLIEPDDIKGIVHAHTTYSDGLYDLKTMAEYAKSNGYEYLAISDHSKSAFYANGLQPERVLQQFAEIDTLNKELAPFRIFKGIESDILNTGELDYDDDLLSQFDFIIASIHSNLRMDEEKATARLIKAIENPYTRILGHPTARLLLARKGYPINHKKVIDACAANNVAIEINAHPHRLDIDWRWIPYCVEKGILISINPDAHSTGGILDVNFGVASARKGGLTATQCLNTRDAAGFEAFISRQ